MIAYRPIAPIALLVLSACSAAPRSIPPTARADVVEAPAIEANPAPIAPPPERACASDADCGYEPARDRCSSDPRANKQPPIVDQGIVCYCDAARCATLRVPPVPCESDASCAVSLDPRPHPVAAGAAHPHHRGRACRDFTHSTTCERTNICTMRVHRCDRERR